MENTMGNHLHEEIVQRLLNIGKQLQDLPPLDEIGGKNWWKQYKAIEGLYKTAKEYALLTIPEDIEVALRSIQERRDALLPSHLAIMKPVQDNEKARTESHE